MEQFVNAKTAMDLFGDYFVKDGSLFEDLYITEEEPTLVSHSFLVEGAGKQAEIFFAWAKAVEELKGKMDTWKKHTDHPLLIVYLLPEPNGEDDEEKWREYRHVNQWEPFWDLISQAPIVSTKRFTMFSILVSRSETVFLPQNRLVLYG